MAIHEIRLTAAQVACQEAQTPAKTMEHCLHHEPTVPFVHDDGGPLVSLRALHKGGGCHGPFSFEFFAPSVHRLSNPAGALRESISFVARETGLSARAAPLGPRPPAGGTHQGSISMRKHLLTACAMALCLAAPTLARATEIGVAMAMFDDRFMTNIREAMSEYAGSLEDVNLQFEDAQADIGRQINQVQNFVAQGVDAIVVNPADTAATQAITDMVAASGIPLVYVNRAPDQKELPEKVVVVVSDDLVAGRLQMEALAECMGGEGNVAIILGELASNATQGRTAGNKEVIEKNPGITVVQEQTANYQRSEAIDLMTNWIVSGEQIDAVSANNDEMAIGAILAMQQAGMSPDQVCVGGIDATTEALDYMERGLLDVTVFQDAKGQGRRAVDAAVKLAKGEPVEQYQMVPYELVTPENMAQYRNR